jgi:hypothetical protein
MTEFRNGLPLSNFTGPVTSPLHGLTFRVPMEKGIGLWTGDADSDATASLSSLPGFARCRLFLKLDSAPQSWLRREFSHKPPADPPVTLPIDGHPISPSPGLAVQSFRNQQYLAMRTVLTSETANPRYFGLELSGSAALAETLVAFSAALNRSVRFYPDAVSRPNPILGPHGLTFLCWAVSFAGDDNMSQSESAALVKRVTAILGERESRLDFLGWQQETAGWFTQVSFAPPLLDKELGFVIRALHNITSGNHALRSDIVAALVDIALADGRASDYEVAIIRRVAQGLEVPL